jgi:hypothetical protein
MEARSEMNSASGLIFRTLFSQPGYTPHCTEHLIDPIDGKEKLVMYDPHTFRGVIIFDIEKKRIDWEFKVPGTEIPNPHQGFMLNEDREGFGSKGSIVCCDRDNNIIVIDRTTREIQFKKKPFSWNPKWLHCINKAVDGNVVATDYLAPRVSKLSLPELDEIWSRTDFPKPSKIMPIIGKDLDHNPSFGGDYVIASNTFNGKIYEIRDVDGSVAWSSDREGVVCDISCPHGCFRMGRVENNGSVTLVHGEGDGTIAGLNYEGIPVFGIMAGSSWERQDKKIRYDFNPFLLGEITSLFPTLGGKIGFCSWNGVNQGNVGEIVNFPDKQRVSYRLKSDATMDRISWSHLINIAGWDETTVVLKNKGFKPLDYQIDGYMSASPRLSNDIEWGRLSSIFAGCVPPGKYYLEAITRNYASLRIGTKSTTAGQSTSYEIWISQKRT